MLTPRNSANYSFNSAVKKISALKKRYRFRKNLIPGRHDHYWLVRKRMGETEFPGVQQQPGNAQRFAEVLIVVQIAVFLISDNGMPQV